MSEHAYVVKYLGSVPVAAAKLTATMWDLFGKEVGIHLFMVLDIILTIGIVVLVFTTLMVVMELQSMP